MREALTCTCCHMWRVEPYPLTITDDGAWQQIRLRVTCNDHEWAVCRTVAEVAAAVPADVFATLTDQ